MRRWSIVLLSFLLLGLLRLPMQPPNPQAVDSCSSSGR